LGYYVGCTILLTYLLLLIPGIEFILDMSVMLSYDTSGGSVGIAQDNKLTRKRK